MWRLQRAFIPKSAVYVQFRNYKQNSTPTAKYGIGKVIFGVIASTGLGFTGAIVYGHYDPKFKSLLENIPYLTDIFKMIPDNKPPESQKDYIIEKKQKDEDESTSGLLKMNSENASFTKIPEHPVEPKPKLFNDVQFENEKHSNEFIILNTEYTSEFPVTKENSISHENTLNETYEKLKKTHEDAINIHKIATSAVKFHSEKLYQALNLSEGKNDDNIRNEINASNLEKEKILKLAQQKATETRNLIKKLKLDVRKLPEQGSGNQSLKGKEDFASKCLQELLRVELQVLAAEKEAKIATEYEQLVKTSKENFRKELQILLPNYFHADKNKIIAEGDLNLLIAHAYSKIEQLQKQIIKQQITDQIKIDEENRCQRLQDKQLTRSKIQSEMQNHSDLEKLIEDRTTSIKADFETQLHQQLLKQTAVHIDHLHEVLKIQEMELKRKHALKLKKKLLHQNGIFISKMSKNVVKLKEIIQYLKRKNEFDKSLKKAQVFWLACQAISYKITFDKPGKLHPLAKDISALRMIVDDDDDDFINSIVSSLPAEAISRGVFTNEILKQRFQKVKSTCRKVALVDENNDSLYRYFLSYVQSFLIADTVPNHNEIEGKVAVDSSEWDTFDILGRISYCLKLNDLEQALRYANQLKGEPKAVAKDWMNEVKLLLETQLAVKALIAHAIALSVQAYH